MFLINWFGENKLKAPNWIIKLNRSNLADTSYETPFDMLYYLQWEENSKIIIFYLKILFMPGKNYSLPNVCLKLKF